MSEEFLEEGIVTNTRKQIFKQTRQYKENLMRRFYNEIDKKDYLDGESISTFIGLANSVEDNVVKIAKLEIAEERNNIESASQENTRDFLKQLHAFDAERRALGEVVVTSEVPDFEPTGMELNEGEVILGDDDETYSQFRERNYDDDDD